MGHAYAACGQAVAYSFRVAQAHSKRVNRERVWPRSGFGWIIGKPHLRMLSREKVMVSQGDCLPAVEIAARDELNLAP
jgi:hypothetical protein